MGDKLTFRLSRKSYSEIDQVFGNHLAADFLDCLYSKYSRYQREHDLRNAMKSGPSDRALDEQIRQIHNAAYELHRQISDADWEALSVINSSDLLGLAPFQPCSVDDLVATLENTLIATANWLDHADPPSDGRGRPTVDYKLEIVSGIVDCYREALGPYPGRSKAGPFIRLVRALFHDLGTKAPNVDYIHAEITKRLENSQ